MDDIPGRALAIAGDARLAVRTTAPGRRRLLAGLWAVAATLAGGCAVSSALQSSPGIDISPIRAGATRQQVETLLAAPVREWTTGRGVRYRLYRYDAGIAPDRGNAAVAVFFDAVSLGLFEVLQATAPNPVELQGARRYALMAVSYDAADRVIGVFADIGEFAALPEDGLPAETPAPAVPASR